MSYTLGNSHPMNCWSFSCLCAKLRGWVEAEVQVLSSSCGLDRRGLGAHPEQSAMPRHFLPATALLAVL